MSYPTTGYTPTISERTRLRNEIKSLIQMRRETIKRAGYIAYTEYLWYRASKAIAQLRTLSAPSADTGDPCDVTGMQARFAALEAALDEPMPKERADQIYLELVELQAAIEKANGAIDNYADGRMMARNLSDSY